MLNFTNQPRRGQFPENAFGGVSGHTQRGLQGIHAQSSVGVVEDGVD